MRCAPEGQRGGFEGSVQEGNGNSAAKGRRDYGEASGGVWMLCRPARAWW